MRQTKLLAVVQGFCLDSLVWSHLLTSPSRMRGNYLEKDVKFNKNSHTNRQFMIKNEPGASCSKLCELNVIIKTSTR